MQLNTVAKYTRQNTGAHFLDSGGAYGRIYNNPLPSAFLSINEYGVTISVTHLLVQYATIHPLHSQLYKYAITEPDMPWFDIGQSFMEKRGFECAARDNTYNVDNDFDQSFVYEVWTKNECSDWIYDESAVIVVYVHTGCDVRGGYASPIVCTFPESEHVMPLDFLVDLYSPDLDDTENELLRVGYSGYPLGQLEGLGYSWLEGSGESAKFINKETQKVITVFPEYFIY